MEKVILYKFDTPEKTVFPCHRYVKSWCFKSEEEEEATFAHYAAHVAEKNGISVNEFHNIFPTLLRILKSNSNWSK
jgi:hypothetical protein